MTEADNIEGGQKAESKGFKQEFSEPSTLVNDSPPTANLPTGQAGEQPPSEIKENFSQLQPSPQPSTLNLKPLTSEMEVHHHGHVHEQKKWKEYVFQFFMLFLAVFCGFLAEYQLEHVVENNREKQYIRSFIEDLKTDTIKINYVLKINREQHAGFDSLMGAIKEPGMRKIPISLENTFPIFSYCSFLIKPIERCNS